MCGFPVYGNPHTFRTPETSVRISGVRKIRTGSVHRKRLCGFPVYGNPHRRISGVRKSAQPKLLGGEYWGTGSKLLLLGLKYLFFFFLFFRGFFFFHLIFPTHPPKTREKVIFCRNTSFPRTMHRNLAALSAFVIRGVQHCCQVGIGRIRAFRDPTHESLCLKVDPSGVISWGFLDLT